MEGLLHLVVIPSIHRWLQCILILVVSIFISVITDFSLYQGLNLTTSINISEVEDTHNRLAFLEGGVVLHVPLFYLEGMHLLCVTSLLLYDY